MTPCLQDAPPEYHTFYGMVTHLPFNNAFISSLSMILVSELGDETFIIAAIMAMRHSRVVVFSGAFAALAVMTVRSPPASRLSSALQARHARASC